MASGTSRILPNTVFRAAADVGSKLVSVGFFVVMARKLGASAFGSLTFGLAFGALVTVLAGFGQDAILTREVARDRRRVDEYFANTLALKLVALAARARDRGAARSSSWTSRNTTRAVAILISVAVLAELLTCDLLRRLPGLSSSSASCPVVIIAQRLFTAGVGIAAMAAGAGIETVAAIYLVGSVLALVARHRRSSSGGSSGRGCEIDTSALVAADAGRAPGRRRARLPGDALPRRRRDPAALRLRARGRACTARRTGSSRRRSSSAGRSAAAVYPVLSRLTETATSCASVFERSLKLAIGATLLFAVGAATPRRPGREPALRRGLPRVGPRARLARARRSCSTPSTMSRGVLLLARNRQRWLGVVYGAMAVENIAANFATIPRTA